MSTLIAIAFTEAEGDGFYPRGRHQHLLLWFIYYITLKNALKSVPSVNKKIKLTFTLL